MKNKKSSLSYKMLRHIAKTRNAGTKGVVACAMISAASLTSCSDDSNILQTETNSDSDNVKSSQALRALPVFDGQNFNDYLDEIQHDPVLIQQFQDELAEDFIGGIENHFTIPVGRKFVMEQWEKEFTDVIVGALDHALDFYAKNPNGSYDLIFEFDGYEDKSDYEDDTTTATTTASSTGSTVTVEVYVEGDGKGNVKGGVKATFSCC